MDCKIIGDYKIMPCTAYRYNGINYTANAILLVYMRYTTDRYYVAFDCEYKNICSINDIKKISFCNNKNIIDSVFVDDIPLQFYDICLRRHSKPTTP